MALKIDELKNINSCLNKARCDEYIFVLLERDKAAAETIRFWCSERIRLGLDAPDSDKIKEAMSCADKMDDTHTR